MKIKLFKIIQYYSFVSLVAVLPVVSVAGEDASDRTIPAVVLAALRIRCSRVLSAQHQTH